MLSTEQVIPQINGRSKVSEGLVNAEAKPRGRRYSKKYKLKILVEADRCQHGELGALLRREGLYSSTISRWREERDAGKLTQTGSEKRQKEADKKELARLRRENGRLQAELAKAEAIIEVQKKLAALLEQIKG